MSIPLENILGLKVKVTNVLDEVTQGKVYSYNSGNNTITLIVGKKGKDKTQSFKIIKTSFIKQLELVGEKTPSAGFKRDNIKPSYVNLDRVSHKLDHAIDEAKKKDRLTGKNVTFEGQFVFDHIHRTISDVRWKGKSILVFEELEIAPPYQVKNVKPVDGKSDVKSKDLIVKIVQSAWNNLDSERKGG